MANTRRKYDATAVASNAAEDALAAISPDASDATIAGIVADYLLTRYSTRYFHLSIIHDVRPSAPVRLARLRKHFPDYQPHEPMGPCPLPYDWTRKNMVGISTRDRERAREWIIAATLAGYCVFRGFSRDSWSSGAGSIARIRERAKASTARYRLTTGETP